MAFILINLQKSLEFILNKIEWENMEDKFKNSGIWEYFSSLNAAIKESKNEIIFNDDNSEDSLQISLENLSMFGPLSLFKERLQPEPSINFEKDFKEYLENQERLNQYEREELPYQQSKKKKKREVKFETKKNQLQKEEVNSKSDQAEDKINLKANSKWSKEEDSDLEEDKEEHDKAEKVKLQNKERAK